MEGKPDYKKLHIEQKFEEALELALQYDYDEALYWRLRTTYTLHGSGRAVKIWKGINDKIKSGFWKINSIIMFSSVLAGAEEYTNAIELLEQGINEFSEIDDPEVTKVYYFQLQNNLAICYNRTQQQDQAVELYKLAWLELEEEIETTEDPELKRQYIDGLVALLTNLANTQSETGKNVEAIDTLEFTINILDDNPNIDHHPSTFHNLATRYVEVGNFQDAVVFLDQADKVAESKMRGPELRRYRIGTDLVRSKISILKGQSDLALEYIRNVEGISKSDSEEESVRYYDTLLWILRTKFEIYLKLGDSKSAGNAVKEIEVIFQKNYPDDAKPLIEVNYWLIKGKWDKNIGNIDNLFSAKAHFKKILNYPTVENKYKTEATSELIDILINELVLNQNSEALKSISELMEQYKAFSFELNQFQNIINFYILQSRLLVINGEYDEAMQSLSEAKFYAIEHGAIFYEKYLNQLEKELLTKFVKIREDLTKSDRIWERIQEVGVDNLKLDIDPPSLYFQEVDYEIIIHPIRFKILQTLDKQHKILRKELIRDLKLKSSRLQYHINILLKEELIDTSYEFVDNKPQSLIALTPQGSLLFTKFINHNYT